jgi:hypothetical protein
MDAPVTYKTAERAPPFPDELERMTREIARKHGCDRAVFTVCWGEHERGETCRCKEEARSALKAKANP